MLEKKASFHNLCPNRQSSAVSWRFPSPSGFSNTSSITEPCEKEMVKAVATKSEVLRYKIGHNPEFWRGSQLIWGKNKKTALRLQGGNNHKFP